MRNVCIAIGCQWDNIDMGKLRESGKRTVAGGGSAVTAAMARGGFEWHNV